MHDYIDADVPILASSLTKRARGYTNLGFPDPRGLPANGQPLGARFVQAHPGMGAGLHGHTGLYSPP